MPAIQSTVKIARKSPDPKPMRFVASAVVVALALVGAVPSGSAQDAHSLRFQGNGVDDIDRVKIRIDEDGPAGGPPADVGATDFTIEFWVRGTVDENTSTSLGCGPSNGWINGNILLDRDRFNQPRNYGVSFASGYLQFGVFGEFDSNTLCSTSMVLDGEWHHVALQRRRSDGWMWIHVDGVQEAIDDGPDGDVSYPDDGVPGDYCGGPCTNSDPFLVIGAEKHDAGSGFPSFSGWFDELRLSTTLRYQDPIFPPPTEPFTADGDTAALYHFDEGSGTTASDAVGLSDGNLEVGGDPEGPLWATDTPFGSTPVGPFDDIAGTTFEDEILWLYERQITAGCNAGSYCPDEPLSRAQMATFLTRALSLEAAVGDTFSDDDGSVHEPNIEALAAASVTGGCSEGLFCPDDPVTRAQMASFIVRGIDGLTPASTDYFEDDTGSTHEANINIVAENAITLGCGDGLYCPADTVTRGQMAAFLFRALDG